jgi:hypothetical protein
VTPGAGVVVWALKIAEVVPKENPDPTGKLAASSYGARIVPADTGYAAFDVDAAFVIKHNPQPGGYYVVYEDGYTSFSPAKAFEDGYTKVEPMLPPGETSGEAVDPVERELQAKGLTALRVTPADIKENIDAEFYFTAHEGALGAAQEHGGEFQAVRHTDRMAEPSMRLLTFCVLVLRNGFTVTGESACVSPENFDPEIGRQLARQNAVAKIWPLMGYALKDRLHREGTAS